MERKIGPNSPCPCKSGKKYKKCCQIYHKGAIAKNAETLMRSRYGAYATGECKYIIKTTHPNNSEYSSDSDKWLKEICRFSKENSFENLKILTYETKEHEAYVTFEATINQEKIVEKSRFLKVGNSWLYESGQFL